MALHAKEKVQKLCDTRKKARVCYWTLLCVLIVDLRLCLISLNVRVVPLNVRVISLNFMVVSA